MRALEARKRIIDFHNLYGRYVEARSLGNEAEAFRIRGEMADAVPRVQRDLDATGYGIYILMDAPALGGRRWPYQLAPLLVLELADQYNVKPGEILMTLRMAASEYDLKINAPVKERVGPTLSAVTLAPVAFFRTIGRAVWEHPGRAGGLAGASVTVAAALLKGFGIV